MLKPFKFVVQTVLLEVDADGNPVDEHVAEQPAVLYGVDAVRAFLDKVEADLTGQAQQEAE